MEQRTQSCRGNERIVRLAAAAVLLTPGAAFGWKIRPWLLSVMAFRRSRPVDAYRVRLANGGWQAGRASCRSNGAGVEATEGVAGSGICRKYLAYSDIQAMQANQEAARRSGIGSTAIKV